MTVSQVIRPLTTGPAGVTGLQAGVIAEGSGPGVPGQERHRLFDRFHRVTAQPGGPGWAWR